MKKKGKISAKTARALKILSTIPDAQFKLFVKIMLLAKDCGINVYAKTGKQKAEAKPARRKGKVKP